MTDIRSIGFLRGVTGSVGGGLTETLYPIEERLMRKLSDPVVWTNLFFILPMLTTAMAGYYLLTATLLLSAVTSVGYHLTREQKYMILDYVFALTNTVVFFMVMLGRLTRPGTLLAVVVALEALRFFRCAREEDLYDRYHAMWHVYISGSLCVLFL